MHGKKLFLLLILFAAPATANEPLWPDLSLHSADDAYTIDVHGRFLVDAGTGAGEGDVNFRRARLGVSGKLAKDFFYKFENDFAADNVPEGITDAYIGYDFNEHLYVQAGQLKEPFNLENMTTSRFATFMERGLTSAFTPGRRVGALVGARDQVGDYAWTFMVGGFDGGIGVSATADDTHDITARGTIAHMADASHTLHAGLATSYRTPDNITDQISFSSVPESRFSGGNAVSTGAITNTDHAQQWGLEAAGVWGPFSLQGEAMRMDLARDAGLPDATFDGYYLQASYFLTGEFRPYLPERGIFGRVMPNEPLLDGGWGAWQVAARYSAIDLTSGGINGGEAQDVTLGLNWIPHHQVVVMGNVVFVNTDATAVEPNDDPTLFMMRLQYDF